MTCCDSDRAWWSQHSTRRWPMTPYVGLDVSLKETKLHVLDEAGNRIWRGRCATEAAAIAAAVRRYAPTAVRIGLETGPLTTWLWTALTAEGLPMICLDARHAKKALDMKVNKSTPPSATDGTRQVRRVRPSYHQIGAGRRDLSHAHDHAGDWAHHRRRLCRRAREARYLQAVARGWCLARAYTAPLPVGRSGLRRPHREAW